MQVLYELNLLPLFNTSLISYKQALSFSHHYLLKLKFLSRIELIVLDDHEELRIIMLFRMHAYIAM